MPASRVKKLPARERLSFYRHLERSEGSGLPLVDSLRSMPAKSRERLGRDLQLFTHELSNGQTLAQATHKHPGLFPRPYNRIVAVGERSGKLHDSFSLLVQDTEDQIAVRQRLLRLAIYPAIMLVVWMLLYPATDAAFYYARAATAGASVSQLQIVGAYFESLLGNIVGLAIIGALVFGAARVFGAIFGPGWFYRALLYVPGLGGALRLRDLSRAATHLSQAMSAGLTYPESLALAAEANDNPALRRRLKLAETNLQGGMTFSDATREARVFPDDALQSIHSGEASGTLDRSLSQLGKDWRQDMTQRMSVVSRILSLLVLAIMAAAVVVVTANQYLRNIRFILDNT